MGVIGRLLGAAVPEAGRWEAAGEGGRLLGGGTAASRPFSVVVVVRIRAGAGGTDECSGEGAAGRFVGVAGRDEGREVGSPAGSPAAGGL